MAHLAPTAAFETREVPEWLLFRWEGGFLGVVFGNRPILELPAFRMGNPALLQGPPPAPPEPAPERSDDREVGAEESWEPGRVFVKVPIPRARARWARDRPDERGLAIARWQWLAEVAGRRSKLYRQLMEASPSEAEKIVGDVFYAKATITLKKRMSAMAMYVTEVGGDSAFPFMEATLYSYVSHLRRAGAPATRATSFLEAVAFTAELLGIDKEPGAEKSARVRGAALELYDRKRVTKQAAPMEVPLVKALELAIKFGADERDRSLAGFAAFVLHSRARASDAARAPSDPVLDEGPGGSGFVQVDTTGQRVKTGRGKRPWTETVEERTSLP